MVNFIDQIFMTDETRYGASLQVMQLFQDFVYRISGCQQLCIRNHLKLLRGDYFKEGKSSLYQWMGDLYFLNLYHKTSMCGADSEKKTSSPSRKMNVRCKSLAQTRKYYWEYQRYTEPNQLNSSEDINVWWMLHRSI